DGSAGALGAGVAGELGFGVAMGGFDGGPPFEAGAGGRERRVADRPGADGRKTRIANATPTRAIAPSATATEGRVWPREEREEDMVAFLATWVLVDHTLDPCRSKQLRDCATMQERLRAASRSVLFVVRRMSHPDSGRSPSHGREGGHGMMRSWYSRSVGTWRSRGGRRWRWSSRSACSRC